MRIREATLEDIGILAGVIRNSYQTVADVFNLTLENCPKHPSNCTEDWVSSDFSRGVSYIILESNGKIAGCAAVEKATSELCYLERLAVLPKHRHKGFGRSLVNHVFAKAVSLGIKKISIGIIARQTDLKTWYQTIGFIEGETKVFEHLPFDVTFMEYEL